LTAYEGSIKVLKNADRFKQFFLLRNALSNDKKSIKNNSMQKMVSFYLLAGKVKGL